MLCVEMTQMRIIACRLVTELLLRHRCHDSTAIDNLTDMVHFVFLYLIYEYTQ